ncbi:MAG: SpoIID/LytB domain-containing protein [Deltaproteobacteria bacterium]|nr:SpoIID/LytB domain-containing protein [Deltaproteobacteria bacterium]
MKKSFRLLILFVVVIVLAGCIKTVSGQAGYGDKIRILVIKGVKEVNIKGSDRGSLEIRRSGYGSVAINGRGRDLPLRLTPQSDFIYLNGKPFRGTIEVRDSKEGLMVINELFLESYLVGIINNEISSKWPEDVIKTQAVIARTYALYSKNKKNKGLYHLEGSIMGQVYSGVGKEDSIAHKAVKETAGEILTYSGEPALTVYHSNAGGMTDSSKDVWAHPYPYLQSVKSPYDIDAPRVYWEYGITAESLKQALNKAGYRIGEPESIDIDNLTSAGRIKTTLITDGDNKRVTLSGEDLRKILGYSNLKSTIFEVTKSGDSFLFKGRGWGHGVGLSQWGAKGMAENGSSYKEILNHFYPGTDLVKVY